MANTYTQIHIQAVFVVKNRACLIRDEWRTDLYKYISGIISNKHHKPLAINGMPDHLHVFFGMKPTESISDLLQDIKASSSKWINDKKLVPGKFSWQAGYGAFSYSKSHVPRVINYIANQEIHHGKTTFLQEYLKFLEEFDVEYDERYLFKEV